MVAPGSKGATWRCHRHRVARRKIEIIEIKQAYQKNRASRESPHGESQRIARFAEWRHEMSEAWRAKPRTLMKANHRRAHRCGSQAVMTS